MPDPMPDPVAVSQGLALLFPGQGSQEPGMGLDLPDRSPGAARVFAAVSDLVSRDMRSVCAGGDGLLDRTEWAQLAIVTVSLAALEARKERLGGLLADGPAAVAGFSLGEYTAFGAAGMLSLPDLVRLLQLRARLMQECADRMPGAMVAILGSDMAVIESACRELRGTDDVEEALSAGRFVTVANDNAPGQVVIAGQESPCLEAARRLSGLGASRTVRLSVQGAFHTPMMREAAGHLAREAAAFPFSAPSVPVYSNRTGERAFDPDGPAPKDMGAALAAHMTCPVRFRDEVLALRRDGFPEMEELGHGRVMAGLWKRNRP